MRNTLVLESKAPLNLVKSFDVRSGSPIPNSNRFSQPPQGMVASMKKSIETDDSGVPQKRQARSPPPSKEPFAFKKEVFNALMEGATNNQSRQ